MKNPRLFVVGDIHGMYDLLMAELDKIDFDRERDILVSVGDLVDRGPDSEKVVRLLDERWFYAVKGNHEDLMVDAFDGRPMGHRQNGGAWFDKLDEMTKVELVERVRNLPVAMTVRSPSGRKIGIVHANVVGDDWDEFIEALGIPHVVQSALWDRDRIFDVKSGMVMNPISNVDHVYFGHTPLPNPITRANMSWIDTKACMFGKLTVVEVK